MSLEQEQHSREPPRTVRLAAAQPTKRAEPNSYLVADRESSLMAKNETQICDVRICEETGSTWYQTNEEMMLKKREIEVGRVFAHLALGGVLGLKN